MQVGSDLHEDGSAGATEPAGCLVSYLAGVLAPGSDQFHEKTGTSRPDEISADGFSSKYWPEQIPARGGGRRREVGEEVGRPKLRS
ncbi:phospho-2-dehydro-3-deoxyheptonate aldolase 2, chloroplastic-like [Dorcoceras hygrometricum]|uniref:Phospho-2-dehydro-3-deoxyheptonate aldolase 2, chloroplastic-like n=1 Tax=Dorcoceras hygrometricum TaxID=472368 RepID=A0A2Z7CMW9_9LAMI|nr:phospho-2-dehydro-3-deoxyheptonate aldolase 2, chloroplastic-like [Dorcoceras hygrometricum]